MPVADDSTAGTLVGLRDDWRVTTGVISGGHLFSHVYLLAFPPLFPLLAEEFALTNAELGLVVSVVNLTGLLQTPVGEAVDRTGAKRVFVAGIVVTAGGTMLASLADSYLALLALAGLAGVGQPAFHPADYAMMDTVTGADTRGKAYSLHSFAGWVGFAAAPLVVGTVGLRYGWRTALVVAGAAGLVYAAVAALVLKPHYLREIDGRDAADGADAGPDGDANAGAGADDADSDTAAEVDTSGDADPLSDRLRSAAVELLNPAILLLFAFFLLMVAAIQGMQSFIPILATEGFGLAAGLGNAALTALPGAAAVGVLLGGVLADRDPPRRVVGSTMLVATAAVWVGTSGLVPVSGTGFVAVFAVAGFFIGVVNPPRDKLVSQYSPPGATGKVFGFVFTGLTIGAIVGPAVFGAAIDLTTAAVGFLFMGATLLVAAAIAFSLGAGVFPDPDHGAETEG